MSEFQLQREQFEREQVMMLSMLQEKVKERELMLQASR
jgi:hypothetical protein